MSAQAPYRRVAEELRREIEELLLSVGFLCRVFARGKSAASIAYKKSISPEKYSLGGRKIQDPVGVRVVLYFPEDVNIVQELIRARYVCDEESTTVDAHAPDVFAVTRHNLIFKVPAPFLRDMQIGRGEDPIDDTFEIQIRSILSEGWHEVEHDLRYKRLGDWKAHADLSRQLNGVVASLETAEWSMRKIFDDLAYRHYRGRSWEAMLHASLRMRLSSTLSTQIAEAIDKEPAMAKALLRIDRPKLFSTLARLAPKVPMTIDNMVYVWAHFKPQLESLRVLTPPFITEVLTSSAGEQTERS